MYLIGTIVQIPPLIPHFLLSSLLFLYSHRRRAIAINLEQDSMAEFSVHKLMKGQDIARIIEACMDRFSEAVGAATPTVKGGNAASSALQGMFKTENQVLKTSQFRAILNEVSSEMGGAISIVEINKLCHVMPHNSFGKLIYTDFPSAFEKTRFSVLKQRFFESQGGLLAAFYSDCLLLEEEQYELRRPRHKGDRHDSISGKSSLRVG